ncbi:hypothetical protein AVEN_168292-1 [Araneus ventricosus]|uniref:Uncharacterized protein n=1 Tax=Araneus ventricosus TaxID=182803 RepID=A0A4Y2WUH4_ARAVE|nr:hypothetical protein AVEN_168292-1 [Araneus ventricosus]
MLQQPCSESLQSCSKFDTARPHVHNKSATSYRNSEDNTDSVGKMVLKKREGSWDGRCHFEPWSDDKDGTLAGTLSKLPHHTSGGTLGTADLLENWVSSLEPSGPETETLSLCR